MFPSQIKFDPNILSSEQKYFLVNKMRNESGPEDADGCKKFTGKGRTGRNKQYGKTKARADIAVLFGNPDSITFNPSRLIFSWNHNWILYKNPVLKCSHLCGFSLCMNINHITFESFAENILRRDHHRDQYCPGHADTPLCVIKTVTPNYE